MDYFNRSEREILKRFAEKRDNAFRPLLSFLSKKGVKPNHVTITGVVFLIAGCVIHVEMAWFIPLLLVLYCLCDDLDGGLARYNGLRNEGGTLIDMAADQAGPVFISAAAIYHLNANGVAAVLFSNSYIAFIVFVVYANMKKINTGTFLRVKYLFFVFYVISMLIHYDLVTTFMYIFAPYYMFYLIYILKQIYTFHEPIPKFEKSSPS